LISSNALRFCLFSVIFGIVRNLFTKFLTNLFRLYLVLRISLLFD